MSTINSANVQVGQSNTPANNITLSTSNSGDLVVSKGASGALVEITRIKNNGEVDASKAGYTPAGTGAVATTVQAHQRKITYASEYGTFQQAITASAGGALYLDSDISVSSSTILDLSACSNTLVYGPGKIIGPAVSVQGQPTAYMKLWGTLGSGVGYGSTIAEFASSFTLANSFAANDLLLLSNFPTDATDAYTEGGADAFGDKARTYANFSTSNLRQTRRKELALVRTATASAFTLMAGTVNAYPSTTALQFQKITPVSGIKFVGVTFENMHINLRYARDISFTACRGLACVLVGQNSYNITADFTEFDAKNTDSRIDFYDACKSLRVTGVYKNINTPADNAIVKFLGCVDFSADVIVEGCKGTAGNGVMVDTAFTESPNGYSDLPAINFSIRAVARGCDGQAVVVTCDPFAAKAQSGQIFLSSDDTGVLLKGCENVDVYGNINYADGSNNSLYLVGAVGTNIFGKLKGNVYNSTVTNPRNGAIQSNSGTSRIGSVSTAANQPAFLSSLSTATTNVTGDGTEVFIAFDSEQFDKSNNHTAGTFTAPLDGIYRFDITLKLNNVGAGHTTGWVRLLAGGANYYIQPSPAAIASASGDCALSLSTICQMTAGQTATAYLLVGGSTKTVGVQGSGLLETFWSGTLVN
jgi:hypothetical protein